MQRYCISSRGMTVHPIAYKRLLNPSAATASTAGRSSGRRMRGYVMRKRGSGRSREIGTSPMVQRTARTLSGANPMKKHRHDRTRAKRKGNRARGKEYWKSRLHRGGEPLGRATKKLTHRKERREQKEI